MLYMRSLLCQITFYLNFLLHGLMAPVALSRSSQVAWEWAASWMLRTMKIWKLTTNSTYEFRGLENLPDGGFIVASKHQSTWETLGLAEALKDVSYVLKQELMYIPIFGWFCWKAKQIPIKRGDRTQAIEPMIKAAKTFIKEGRRIVIFMEGTRVPAGAKGKYKLGVASMYRSLDCPVVPVALNTGLFWPRNSFFRYSGHVIIEFLPPIMPGKPIRQILRQLENEVETATNRLLLETARSDNPPPTMGAALDAMEERGIDISSVR